ncbi:MAG: DUF1667 domain-containing protein [Anaerolineae bacterium]|nr:DUF1667 domain-containing protein [Anaerolineae bacterium]
MPVTEKMICITCPMGCTLQVTHEGETVLNVEGNACKRGEEYVKRELTDPRRMVATTVKVKGGTHPLLPVYTESAVSKPRIFELLQKVREVELQAPVTMGDVILEDPLGDGINIVASRSMPAQTK